MARIFHAFEPPTAADRLLALVLPSAQRFLPPSVLFTCARGVAIVPNCVTLVRAWTEPAVATDAIVRIERIV
ncbi:hypothetical protein PI86_11990 [Burkholderia sp. A9]|nr:hypothetical protein PI86_11990 [Burkholderia sp. A9]